MAAPLFVPEIVSCPGVKADKGEVNEYRIHFSDSRPSDGNFAPGDLWFTTGEVERASKEKIDKTSRADLGAYAQKAQVFYYDANGWNSADTGHTNEFVKHPCRRDIELDTRRMSWRYKLRFKAARHNDGSITKPACTANNWIADVLKEWNAIGAPQTHSDGEAALKRLLEFKDPIPANPPETSRIFITMPGLRTSTPLTRQVIMKDILNSQDFGVHSTPEVEKISSLQEQKVEFLVCYNSAGRKSWSEDDALITMFNKQAAEIYKCGVIVPPDLDINRPDMVYAPKPNQMQCDSVICPPGAITSIHSDEHGIAFSCLHAYGAKLWFAWPPTSENVRAYMKYLYTKGRLFKIADAIEQLTGLEVFYIKSGEQPAWVMPPGVLHAVMTLSEPAAHTGFYFIQKDHFEMVTSTIDTVIRMTSLLPDAVIAEIVEEVNMSIGRVQGSDLHTWGCLIQKMRKAGLGETSDYKQISRWHNEETNRIERLAKHVKKVVKNQGKG